DAGDGHARVLCLHLEGPFVNPLAAGALPRADLAGPSVAALAALLGPATGDGRGIRTVTVAPELPGSAELVGELTRAGVRASFGHSRATAAEARAVLRGGGGASGRPEQPFGVTHLFNAMTGVHHRDPGLASLALTDEALVVELIGDLVHVGPEAIDLALRARGAAGLALVSDALEGAGTGCDVFHSHGRAHLCHSGAAWYPGDRDEAVSGPPRDGVHAPRSERLAGSATGQLEAVQRLVARGVVSAADALTMATFAPARALGMETELGVLAPRARADVIELDPKSLALRRVLLAGRPLPAATSA
ncbi:MAG: amidohydrolase family protein, partial [Planctomycetota bacterium]|nr:amidohydrolase family protein [Planctomycetota bacterium]